MSRPAVLHLSTAANDGGSGRAAWRIHQGLLALGHPSRMLVGVNAQGDESVDTVWNGRAMWAADRIADHLCGKLGLQYLWLPSSRRVSHHPWTVDCQIIQAYNLHGGWFALPTLAAIARGRPVVWRLSDMWPFTGHCAYAKDCERWRTGCGACPALNAEPAVGRDTTAWLWRQKQRLYADLRLEIVAPSTWIRDLAQASPLFAGKQVHLIPNGLDLEVFRPLRRSVARDVLGLPQDATIVMFSARNLDDGRKGADTAMAALAHAGAGTRALLVGAGGSGWRARFGERIHLLGLVNHDRLLAAAYAAADVILVPSTADNLPNSALEGMACGVPVLAFDAGGMRDAVIDGETGRLVPPGDDAAFSNALASLLADPGERERLGTGARAHVERNFNAHNQAERFSALYQKLIDA